MVPFYQALKTNKNEENSQMIDQICSSIVEKLPGTYLHNIFMQTFVQEDENSNGDNKNDSELEEFKLKDAIKSEDFESQKDELIKNLDDDIDEEVKKNQEEQLMIIMKQRQDKKDADWADDSYFDLNLKKRVTELVNFIDSIAKSKNDINKIEDLQKTLDEKVFEYHNISNVIKFIIKSEA